jgi:hypothetical protein
VKDHIYITAALQGINTMRQRLRECEIQATDKNNAAHNAAETQAKVLNTSPAKIHAIVTSAHLTCQTVKQAIMSS